MKKLIRAIMSIIIILGVLFIPKTVYAEDEEYKEFLQGDSRWASYAYDGGSDTIGGQGCAITSITMFMAYADPALRDVNKFNPKIASQNYLRFDGNGCIYWEPKAGPLKLVNFAISSKDDVKSAMDKGYYVVAWTSRVYGSGTHYSPIVGWDDANNKPIIWDVAGGGKTWDDFTNNSTDISGFRVYESTKLKSTESLTGRGASTSEGSAERQALAFANVTKEWDLRGMPTKVAVTDKAVDLSKADKSNLSLAERINMGEIQDNISSRHKNAQQIANMCFVIAGLMLIVYSLLLSVGYVFDKSNSFINVSMVSLLTLGRLKIVDANEKITEEMQKEGYVKPGALYIRCVIILLLGCLLISGLIPMLVMKIVYAIL